MRRAMIVLLVVLLGIAMLVPLKPLRSVHAAPTVSTSASPTLEWSVQNAFAGTPLTLAIARLGGGYDVLAGDSVGNVRVFRRGVYVTQYGGSNYASYIAYSSSASYIQLSSSLNSYSIIGYNGSTFELASFTSSQSIGTAGILFKPVVTSNGIMAVERAYVSFTGDYYIYGLLVFWNGTVASVASQLTNKPDVGLVAGMGYLLYRFYSEIDIVNASTLQAVQTLTSYTYGFVADVAVGDIDSDGAPDIIVDTVINATAGLYGVTRFEWNGTTFVNVTTVHMWLDDFSLYRDTLIGYNSSGLLVYNFTSASIQLFVPFATGTDGKVTWVSEGYTSNYGYVLGTPTIMLHDGTPYAFYTTNETVRLVSLSGSVLLQLNATSGFTTNSVLADIDLDGYLELIVADGTSLLCYGTSISSTGVNDAYQDARSFQAYDTDGDGLSDSVEDAIGTNAYNPDTDRDGLLDGAEVNIYGTSPTNPDTDGDGYSDGFEVANGMNPLSPDIPSGGSGSTQGPPPYSGSGDDWSVVAVISIAVLVGGGIAYARQQSARRGSRRRKLR